jgi:uncharacterized membrane protein YphA (DoxX/SURF4 family)
VWFEAVAPIAPLTFMVINGIFELLLAALLLVGYFTRIAAFISALHIAVIGFIIGYGDVAIRDFALAIASLATFLYGPDVLCLEER